ncbi:hypothetical protein [Kineosporia babensis]|uniref:Uncharacterized protein n=1 Tax=Kineosporia babensis TaxID=499548 RepID=A0A9X1N956_9ACTN|nr:hypothetical protein [Kineosporia babensis]MCD5310817.1 hypothetical protein [Kineosporia babensis]
MNGRVYVAPLGTQPPPSPKWVPVGFCTDFAFEPVEPMVAWEPFSFAREYAFTVELEPPKTRREIRNQEQLWAVFAGVKHWRAWQARRRRIATQQRHVERRARKRHGS